MNPPPNGNHESVFSRITRQIVRKSAVEVDISGGRGVATPFGRYIPDITIAELGAFEGEPSWGTAAGILMLVEITSGNRNTDREEKRRGYAAAGIPLYLLVDRNLGESVLFSVPDVEAQDYREDVRVMFGSDLELPAPFSFTLQDFTTRA